MARANPAAPIQRRYAERAPRSERGAWHGLEDTQAEADHSKRHESCRALEAERSAIGDRLHVAALKETTEPRPGETLRACACRGWMRGPAIEDIGERQSFATGRRCVETLFSYRGNGDRANTARTCSEPEALVDGWKMLLRQGAARAAWELNYGTRTAAELTNTAGLLDFVRKTMLHAKARRRSAVAAWCGTPGATAEGSLPGVAPLPDFEAATRFAVDRRERPPAGNREDDATITRNQQSYRLIT